MGRRKSDVLDWRTMDHLVDELTKAKPNEEAVELLMQQAGLTYNSDPIARMSTVLELIGKDQAQRRRRDREGSL
jgi:hypothetical protein